MDKDKEKGYKPKEKNVAKLLLFIDKIKKEKEDNGK